MMCVESMAERLGLSDVMVGDWVDVRNEVAPNTPHIERITPSHFLRDEYWYGIPLTPEIVEANRLQFRENHSFCIIHFFEDGVFVSAHGYYESVNLGYRSVVYVHELQHVFRICGINKEIKL